MNRSCGKAPFALIWHFIPPLQIQALNRKDAATEEKGCRNQIQTPNSIAIGKPLHRRIAHTLMAILLLIPAGCRFLQPTGARIIAYHARQCLISIETLTQRLYAKNPGYEPDPVRRQEKLNAIFAHDRPSGKFSGQTSRELLTAAFATKAAYPDRVYLMGLGMVKSIREAYGLDRPYELVTGMQIPLERLERLHHNISQVNWRLKTYRGETGELIFQTNAAGKNGYINMGYEVLMTEILTRIKDDIHLRGGLAEKYAFSMSTLFLSILL